MKQRYLRQQPGGADGARLKIKGRLRLWRKHDLEISQRHMAAAAGVSRNTVQRWESADSAAAPTLVHVARICAAVGERPSDAARWLLDGGQDLG